MGNPNRDELVAALRKLDATDRAVVYAESLIPGRPFHESALNSKSAQLQQLAIDKPGYTDDPAGLQHVMNQEGLQA